MPLRLNMSNLTTLLERPEPKGMDAAPPEMTDAAPAAEQIFVADSAPTSWTRFVPTYSNLGTAWTTLCSGGLSHSRHLFAVEDRPCHRTMTERGLERSLAKSRRTEFYTERLSLYDNFNKHLSPRLQLEESFLQVLAQRFVYGKLPVSTSNQPYWFDCHVNTDLRGALFKDRDYRYHNSYHIFKTEENPLGCTAFWLEPGKKAGRHHNSRSRIILFRGTYNHGGRDVLAQNAPTGWLTNTDPANIGHRAFQASKEKLISWVQECVNNNQAVVISGHSLGGAQAQQLFASLPEEAQRKCRLVTFGAPGVSQETVAKMPQESALERSNRMRRKMPSPIKMIWHEADPVVHLFGQSFPKSEGTRILAKVDWNDIIQTHSRLYIVLAEAWRGEIFYREEDSPRIWINGAEYLRSYFGSFISNNLAADWPFH